MAQRPRVVIVGAGFGGLYAARTLENKPVDVLLIDRNNFHMFTPLLYQVATCGLEPEEIAYPVRGIFRGKGNIQFLLGEVSHIDRTAQTVSVHIDAMERREHYDFLIVAGGSVTNFFGNDSIARHAFGLKDLNEAVSLRNHILRMFECAAWSDDPKYREALTTMVVIGGGPTGLETAGALYELYTKVLAKEYAFLRTMKPRVLLVEATDRLLIPFPEQLQEAALDQLRDLGVEVILSNPVESVYPDHVILKDGTQIETHTLVWAAGVKASPLAEMLHTELVRGRVPVTPTMHMLADERVFVVGDMAYLQDENGQPYPMLIPVAKQQGILAAKNILLRLNRETEGQFRYIDRGIMATIGRSRAVAWIYNRIPLRGFPAWASWLGLHLVALMGFRNRLNVLLNWVWEYITYDRSVRIILEREAGEQSAQRQEAEAANTPENDGREHQRQGLWAGR